MRIGGGKCPQKEKEIPLKDTLPPAYYLTEDNEINLGNPMIFLCILLPTVLIISHIVSELQQNVCTTILK